MTNGIELVDVETDPKICEKFQEEMDERTAALAMIAPYLPAKVSPSKALWAEIGLVEDTIHKLKESLL